MKQLLTTYRRAFKVISLLIVSTFIFAQFATASHVHDHAETDLAPCAVCITTSHNDGDLDIPPPEPSEPLIPSVNHLTQSIISQPLPPFARDDDKAPPPSDIRPSAPRAPPV